MLQRVLISNRGEIAIRIARAASSLGIESVAVYAPVDSLSLHTRMATEAHEIGSASAGSNPVAAYLDIEALLDIAKRTGCDCVHPGYGFLAESPAFAERCAAEGLTFVGPSAATLSLFGDKLRARSLAGTVGVPVVPGGGKALATVAAAKEEAAALGYPVMLKAAAGGGGRGMRVVARPDDLAEAFERCAGEAGAAFGDASLFLEKLVSRPRHVEVQVLADRHGNTIHLYERDCSVQIRHQKVVEIAPAPALDDELRGRIHADAIRLVEAADYRNAGTVEFLVDPEAATHFFIECNPRIQVEHTVPEEVMGVDLVEAQFRIAAGESLEELGLADQQAVGAPRGYAAQARVFVTAGGTLAAYREPSGRGVRVDGCGYLGYAPPPHFDPLLAKVIGRSGSAATLASALDRTRAALGEFHIEGVETNLASLRFLMSHPAVRSGDARTSLIAEIEDCGDSAVADDDGDAGPAALDLLRDQARGVSRSRAAEPGAASPAGLAVADGLRGVATPLAGSVIELRVGAGTEVAAGEPILVLSAMKMETVVAAPCAGRLVEVQSLSPGDEVGGGQVFAVIDPREPVGARSPEPDPSETWAPVLDDVRRLRDLAAARLAPGSDDPGVVRQRDRGKLTCRERIALLLDEDSFQEVGSATGFASYDEEGRIVAFTPANHVGGWGRIDGRTAVVCADDFTSRGGHADGAIGSKSRHLEQLSLELRAPSVRLLDGSSGGGSVAAMVPQQKKEGESRAKESSGAIASGRPRVAGAGGSFLPGHLGSSLYTEQLATVPVVNVLLGSVVGIGAAKAVLGHFSVMVRDIAQLFVAGPPVVSHAMGYDITKEELGDWRIHCRNGSVDNLAASEAEAMAATRRFLSYLPSSVYEPPPILAPAADDPADRREEELFTLVPRRRTTTFDIRRAIELMADRGSFFEIGPLWGTDQVTGLARFNGHPMGVLASDSRHPNGGAMTADGCRKLTRHLDLCDLFHIPILNLIDNPGFAVGKEHEIAGTIRCGGEWMVAFAQVEVPIFSVLMRRSFGVAGNNFATPKERPSVRVAWPSADVGGIPPEGGIEAAYKRQLAEAEDPEAFRAELMARIESARGPVGPLNRFQVEEMIDPRDTRRLVCDWVDNAFRVLSHPGRLGPRAIQFRP
ncbi:MAG: carboxyl transferase domain-containing protein [Thermoanaerobaculia bacterium]|nr:carboxyl transferase domain-containing protein [Thermoanaerobaculia bacterium]